MIAVKLAGIILTLGASAALGWYFSNLAVFRRQDLLEFKKALLILKSEIEYIASPLPEAMANIAVRTTPPVARLFALFAESLKHNESGETAYQLWLSAIGECKKQIFLKEEDWEAISSFGKTLGYLDKQMQLDSIGFTCGYIDQEVAVLQSEIEKSRRMYRSLGIIGGILLVVIFW